MEVNINVNIPEKAIEHLPFQAVREDSSLALTNQYFEKDGKPWYPIMGEFHYSRFPDSQWNREIYKMKSGGVDIVASYVIWIHHEEIQGEFDFTGQRNLRKFVEECQKADIGFFLRIGPWAHGEVRNGGFPDWVQHSGWDLRSNDPNYLKCVRTYFEKIYEQVNGLFYKDGGPIIGIQIENEYGHVGGYRGKKGSDHILTLKKMLIEIGFDVPYYTTTGWGGGVVIDNETIPVFGGYVDAPWHPHTEELPANENFVFKPYFNDSLIASDHTSADQKFEYGFSIEKYPYLTAELGGGLQVTKHRRPIVSAKDTEAQSMVKLASGANLLGYYMYHGGVNPKGKLTSLQESKETGMYTDVPILSYDFQAPLRAYGQFNESYGALRKLHQLIHSFEDILVTSRTVNIHPVIHNPSDLESLRYCVRFDEKTESGFLFVNNYQRRRRMKEHHNVQFSLQSNDRVIEFPSMDIKDGETGIYPFNLKLNGYHLESSNATLYTIVDQVWIFYHSRPENACIKFIGDAPKYIIITEDQANRSLKHRDKLYISNGDLWLEGNDLYVSSDEYKVMVVEYPGKITTEICFAPANGIVTLHAIESSMEFKEFRLTFEYNGSADTDDFYLEVDFRGDRGELYDPSGDLIADWFSTGEVWKVSMKALNYPEKAILKVFTTETDTYYERDLGTGCEVKSTQLTPVYVKNIHL